MTTAVSRDFARHLPKIELHAHLTGSISRDCLHHIWLKKKEADPTLELPDPLDAIPPDGIASNHNIKTAFSLFSSFIYKLCNDLASIELSTRAVLHDFQADGVVYLELRTTPRAITESGVSKDGYIQTVLRILREHNEHVTNTMQAFLIVSIDRRNTTAEAEEVVDLAIKHQAAGVVGVDLCGDPSKGDVRIFEKAFRRAKAAGLKITLHFAETPRSSSDEELQTLLSWHPDRLGHVINVKEVFQEEIKRQNIAVELCLSCNVQLRLFKGSYADHHFGMWRHSGVPVILCTDDVGVFCSPLSQEYFLAAEHFGIDKQQLHALSEGAIDAIFAGSEQRSHLRNVLNLHKYLSP